VSFVHFNRIQANRRIPCYPSSFITAIVDYSKEPEELFLPLDEIRYCEFYDVEMNDFTSDIPFYLTSLSPGSDILELGCGSGRLSRALAAQGHSVTGIDISTEMLARCASHKDAHVSSICMDMTELSLPSQFDAAIIPYNSLNLLETLEKVACCLKRVRAHLKEGGRLLLQTFLPDTVSLPSAGTRTFQFRIFKTADGGKLIKETIKQYKEGDRRIELTERYRVRPAGGMKKNEDLAHSLHLLAFSYGQLTGLLAEAGFLITCQYGGYDLFPFIQERDRLLLLISRAI